MEQNIKVPTTREMWKKGKNDTVRVVDGAKKKGKQKSLSKYLFFIFISPSRTNVFFFRSDGKKFLKKNFIKLTFFKTIRVFFI